MKKILMSVLFLSTVSVFAEVVQVSIPGAVCQMCVFGLRKQFKDVVLDRKKDIKVDLENKLATLTLAKTLSDEEIRKRVVDAGYEAKEIVRLKDVPKKDVSVPNAAKESLAKDADKAKAED